jgi:O-antigen ligase
MSDLMTLKITPAATKNLRLLATFFLAAAASLPIAIISIAKLFAVVISILLLASDWRKSPARATALIGTVDKLIFGCVGLFLLSAFWSAGSLSEIIKSVTQHGNLLIIPLLLYLIRTREEALGALKVFFLGQVFLMLSSWLMYLGVPVPWAISKESGISFAVFSSYLDQSTMMGVLGALTWHFREKFDRKISRFLVPTVIFLSIGCVFFVFQGRTGHLVGAALLSAGLAWALPKRLRLAAILMPIFVVMTIGFASPKVQQRFTEVRSEVSSFSQSGDTKTSSGTRLDFWQRSLQAIAERPLLGWGAGGWNAAYDSFQVRGPDYQPTSGNPHQEYLLWGVELGFLGIGLLIAVLIAIALESKKMSMPSQRAQQSILLAVVVSGLFNCSLYDALSGDYLCIALGLVRCLGLTSENDLPATVPNPQYRPVCQPT